MSRNVILSISTKTQAFPAGTQFGGFKFSLAPANGGPAGETVTPELTVTFANVPAGRYVAKAEALDANGALLGAAVTADVEVVDAQVSLAVPDTLSFTLA